MKSISAFLLGMREYRLSFTTHHTTESQRHAYDLGRDFAHRMTLRRYDEV